LNRAREKRASEYLSKESVRERETERQRERERERERERKRDFLLVTLSGRLTGIYDRDLATCSITISAGAKSA